MANDNLDAFLESLGQDKDKFLTSKDIVDDILISWGQGAIDSIRRVLKKEGLFASGGLYQEIEPWKIKKISDGIQVYLEMLEYWEEVDKGRQKGKKLTDQELRSLEDWIKIKGIPSKWRMKPASAVFLISRAIYKKGTIKRYGYRGSNFIEQAMTDSIMNELQGKFAKSFESFYLKGVKKT